MGIILIIMPACLYTSGRVYWVLSMGRIHRTPHLAHVVLCRLLVAPTVQSDSITLTIFQYSQYSVSACYKFVHCIQLAQYSVFSVSISCSDYFIALLLCSVICYFSFTLSCMLSTFQVLTHTCATSSHDVG